MVSLAGLFDVAPFALATLFTLAVTLAGVKSVRTGYSIRATEPVPASQVPAESGRLTVQGVARPAEKTLEAPLTGTPSLAYEWWRETDFDPNSPSSDYETVNEESEAVPFYVEDDSGRVAVVPGDAWVSLPTDEQHTDGDDREFEKRLDPGDEVHVYGQQRAAATAQEGLPGANTYVGSGEIVDRTRITEGADRRAWLEPLLLGILVTLVAGFLFALSLRGLLGTAGLV